MSYVFLFITSLRKPTNSSLFTENLPVSVVICARNSCTLLRRNLPKILSATRSIDEVIVVDDFSDDDTADYLKTVNHPSFRFYKNNTTQGKKYAQKLGVEQASHQTILVTDADCYPADNAWMTSTSNSIGHHEYLLLYGPYERTSGWLNKIIRYETWMTVLQYISGYLMGSPYMGVGRNLMWKKHSYLSGLREDYYNLPYGDDDLLIAAHATKSNTSYNLRPDSWVYSQPSRSWNQWLAQKQRHVSTGKYYSWRQKLVASMFPLSVLGMWIIYLTGISNSLSWMLLYRYTLMFVFMGWAMRRMGVGDLILLFPILEFIWIGYLFIVSPYIFLKNKTSWN